MYENFFLATSLSIALVGCHTHDEAIVESPAVIQNAREFGEIKYF